MPKFTKWEQAMMCLRPQYKTKNFTYEEAKLYLLNTGFGNFTKTSWNAAIKHDIIKIDNNNTAYFVSEKNEAIDSDWTNSHRKYFICEQDKTKKGYGDFFTKDELTSINNIYFNWKSTCETYQYYGFRRPNLPEPISEGLPSALFGWARTNNMPLENIDGSADLVDTINGNAIQIKGISAYDEKDCGPTSFGPNSKFDRLIVLYVRLDEDKVYFYEFPDAQDYKEWKVNENQTVADQQSQNKRPRLNLIPILKEKGIQPFFVYNFNA